MNINWIRLALLILLASHVSGAQERSIPLASEMVSEGTISFEMHVERDLQNGIDEKAVLQKLISIPERLVIYIGKNQSSVDLLVYFFNSGKHQYCFNLQFNKLFKAVPASLFLSWDASRGKVELYLNGRSFIDPDVRIKPFQFKGNAIAYRLYPSELVRLEKVQVRHRYSDYPKGIHHSVAPSFEKKRVIFDEIERLKGQLLYHSSLDQEECRNNWSAEGPVHIFFANQKMVLRTDRKLLKANGKGHFNIWYRKILPENFIAEWTYTPLSKQGLSMVMFAAKGNQGTDIWDGMLKKRSGIFKEYVFGDIRNYYVTYYSNLPFYQPGRIHSNLRKNPGLYLLQTGPMAIPAALSHQKESVDLCLVKQGNRIRLIINRQNCLIDYRDDQSSRYGVHFSDGAIGFRQMAGTVAAYSRFKVWEIKRIERRSMENKPISRN